MIKNKFILQVSFFFFLFLFWHLILLVFEIPEYILPKPLSVLNSWIENKEIMIYNASITFREAFFGFLIANFIAMTISIFTFFYKNLENFIVPMAVTIKTIPIIAIIPLLAIWFGSGMASKIMAAALVCFFPALVNILEGIKMLDKKMIWLFKIYAANKAQLIQKLILPSIMPYFFAALKTSSSLAMVGALVSEFIGSNKGLGFVIISNYYNMETAIVFAAIATSSVIGILFYYSIHFLGLKIIYKNFEKEIK